ncbi:uncharacterized protein N7487_007537 [Penicillium crustosum]|uniref:uncharacterized protein n=1 Tax=Penicillium crustosum TaxID=36656 RepID=UPI0023973853|nr:uncharacterized protein N7487_007537 [Penicillium crustosum]KAJ5401641.1 hypothetical protein N7487_007537 [Penicillium crustosum]
MGVGADFVSFFAKAAWQLPRGPAIERYKPQAYIITARPQVSRSTSWSHEVAPGGIRFAHPVWVQLLLLLGGLFASLGEKAPNRLEHNPTVAHRRGSPRCGNKPVLTLFNVKSKTFSASDDSLFIWMGQALT